MPHILDYKLKKKTGVLELHTFRLFHLNPNSLNEYESPYVGSLNF
jgi:hypothetical protein